MGLKTKWNRFWTLRNTEGGFTLVELVIVIAILAILAGIAVPTYSGYIKKAREATDMQLIAAVNTAFGAACLEQGIQTSDVTEAAISVMDQKVYGLSSVTAPGADVDAIHNSFENLYAGNENAVFITEDVCSLIWDTENSTFEISHEYVATRVRLANGGTISIPAADIQAARDSGYAAMGVPLVTAALMRVNDSAVNLASVAGAAKIGILTDALVAKGILTQDEADAIADDMGLGNAIGGIIGGIMGDNSTSEAYAAAAGVAANGLQLSVAQYIAERTAAGDTAAIQALATAPLGNNTTGLLNSYSELGGTRATSALAMQYALAESFANNSNFSNTEVTYVTKDWLGRETSHTMSVQEYLASEHAANDPVAAIALIQGTTAYSQQYMGSTSYNNDINGFAATMGAVGANLGEIRTEYLYGDSNDNSGIESESAQTILGVLLGSSDTSTGTN